MSVHIVTRAILIIDCLDSKVCSVTNGKVFAYNSPH